MTKKLFMLLFAFIVGSNALDATPAQAQTNYPTRAVKIIIPFATGGGSDMTARLLAQHLQQTLGSPFVVENKPGADSLIAVDYVKRSEPDGYTLLLGQSSSMTINPAINPNIPYKPLIDFAPISLIGTFALVLAVNAQSEITHLDQLIKRAHDKQGGLSVGLATIAYQVVMKMIARDREFSFTSIPYRGSGPAVTGLLTGEIDATLTDIASAKSLIESGAIRALAVTGAARSEFLPKVPTLQELGSKNFNVEFWSGLFAPAGTPVDIVEKLRREIKAFVQTSELKKQADLLGMKPLVSDPPAMKKLIQDDINTYTEIVKGGGFVVK